MALQDKLRSRAAPFLEPGEEVRQILLAESGASPWMRLAVVIGFGVFVMLLLMRPLIIAVTDRSVVVFRAGRFRPGTPKEILARLPRQTRLGPTSGPLWAKVHVAGQRLWIHRRFFKDVAAADAPLLAPPSAAAMSPAGGGGGLDLPPAGDSPPTSAPFPSALPPTGSWSSTAAGAQVSSAQATSGSWGSPVPSAYGPSPPPAVGGTWPLEKGGRPWQWVLAGVAGLATLLVAIAVLGNADESAARDRLAAYVAGTERHSFVASDGRFRAEFPGPPRRDTQTESFGDIELETVAYQRDVGLDTSFVVTFVDLPGVPPDMTAALNGAANAIAVGLEGEILTSSQSDRAGRPAIEFLVESRLDGGTKDVHYGRLILVVDNQRLYSVGVIGPDNPPDGFEAFLASFAIGP